MTNSKERFVTKELEYIYLDIVFKIDNLYRYAQLVVLAPSNKANDVKSICVDEWIQKVTISYGKSNFLIDNQTEKVVNGFSFKKGISRVTTNNLKYILIEELSASLESLMFDFI